MQDYPKAFDEDHLHELLKSNDSCATPARDEVERLDTLVEQRQDARTEPARDCLIATDWSGFAADNFGFDNGEMNEFAMGTYERATDNADLFNDTVVVQNGWLTTGDGRRSQVQQYNDDDFDGADVGQLWLPRSAQDYIAVIEVAVDG
jgi:hypothetical protein